MDVDAPDVMDGVENCC